MSQNAMSTHNKPMIGVVGGIGPYAGIDLVKKIFDQTKATCDQDHLPVSMLSVPHSIQDRTEFLLGKSEINPALAISEVIGDLYKSGASVIGMPCNTAHAAPIFNEIVQRIPKEIKLVHLIDEVAKYIKEQYPSVMNVGVLSTTGTIMSNIYPDCLSQHGLAGVQVLEEIQERHVHPAIYSPVHGIKKQSNPVTDQAKEGLQIGVDYLLGQGVDVIVLGCTEIPLALTEANIKGIPLIDATKVLARALILEAAPEALLE
ncbi:MAG: aspartate/glutamate racemase family protein [Leptolyngbyaceae cyanobacterium]